MLILPSTTSRDLWCCFICCITLIKNGNWYLILSKWSWFKKFYWIISLYQLRVISPSHWYLDWSFLIQTSSYVLISLTSETYYLINFNKESVIIVNYHNVHILGKYCTELHNINLDSRAGEGTFFYKISRWTKKMNC